ncbi:hypothetical protein [Methanobacterium aggregans]|uniref:hypothetical protein n=1 Tax=Methanobacterium aggregans TaxID=1615586 RepID=UPI001AE6162C|nr:hypothetical protein [Methanobacterium aggregans]MBP2045145.1 hypothetical protein [Methanobacterium aggregans]
MSEERMNGVYSGNPPNDSVLDNGLAKLPEKLNSPPVPHFRGKPVQQAGDGFSLFFKEVNGYEYWLSEEKRGSFYLVQWLELTDSESRRFHRKISNRNGLDVENKKRDVSLTNYLHDKTGVEKAEISQYLEEVGIFIGENRLELSPVFEEPELHEKIPPEKEADDIPEEKRKELIQLLKRPDLLSFIDEALYERSPDDGFIIGEVESKHTLNFNCLGARLGLSTINTLKGDSSIGKTNTANVVTGLHRTKKVGSLSDTALKYADDLENIDILYIQETLEEEFKNKETRLMSADDGGFIAETTVKNPKTGQFEVQQTTIPVKTLVTTTTAIELDPEFASRNFIIPVDDSEEQTERILGENFRSTEKKLQELKGEIDFNHKYELLRESYKILNPYLVLIPYETDLMDIFPTSNPRARRDSKKLMQLIKESALLFQYQRCTAELHEKHVLVASWVDLAHAILLSGPIMEATITGFDRRLLESLPIIYGIIDETGYVTTRSLQKELRKSSKYAWQILNFFEDNSYICHDNETKREYGIKGKTKVYVKTESNKYKSLILDIGNIDWIKIKNKEEKFIKTQIPNSSHTVIDEIYLPRYDPSVPNHVVYNKVSLSSEELRNYRTNGRHEAKIHNKQSENLIEDNRIENRDKVVKQVDGADIDYRNLTIIEKAVLTELASFSKHSIRSIIKELKDRFHTDEIMSTITHMEGKGWLQ